MRDNLLREPTNQSINNLKFLDEIQKYVEESPGSLNEKFENFQKYVSRETITKFLARSEIFLKQLNIHGSIIELGVGRGSSLMTWAHLSSIYEPANYNRKIFGFDTFYGFPSIDIEDKNSEGVSSQVKIGGFCFGENIKEDIERAINIHDLTRFLGHIPKVKLIKGDITTTLPDFIHSNPFLIVSLLHIDVDLFKPTRIGLELLIPKIPKGGIIVFDEINSELFPGETIALAETIGINSIKINRLSYCPSISYTIIE